MGVSPSEIGFFHHAVRLCRREFYGTVVKDRSFDSVQPVLLAQNREFGNRAG